MGTVAVIGGGIVGVQIARELQLKGELITLYDFPLLPDIDFIMISPLLKTKSHDAVSGSSTSTSTTSHFVFFISSANAECISSLFFYFDTRTVAQSEKITGDSSFFEEEENGRKQKRCMLQHNNKKHFLPLILPSCIFLCSRHAR